MNSESRGPIVAIQNVTKEYDRGRIAVLRGVSAEVGSREIVALWGASGSGKSTLLHLIAGLDLATAGEISVAGLDPGLEKNRLILRRHHVGMVFQLHNLIADLTVAENLRLPTLALGLPRAQAVQRSDEVAAQLSMTHRLGHRIQDLSGGERQRVAIGRALMNRPRLILADEPTGSLDERTGEVVFELLRTLARETGAAVIIATHERRFALACDRVLHLRDGRFESM